MDYVRAKKALGQHFLKDHNIARNIANSLSGSFTRVLEIGPGTGMLTQYLLENPALDVSVIEIDRESVAYLNTHFPQLKDRILERDFLKMDLTKFSDKPFAIIGNFPYNISSQIFFKALEQRDLVPEVVCMIQKEVAERMAAPHGNKTYGILSVLMQSFYRIEYLFTVSEQVFVPPPKVKSAVIRMIRNETKELGCNEKLFIRVVKAGFNQRRKTLSNSLKSAGYRLPANSIYASKRAEQLSIDEFVKLTLEVESEMNILLQSSQNIES